MTLPPYIYGREAGPNEKVWTESAVRLLLAEGATHAAAAAQRPDPVQAAYELALRTVLAANLSVEHRQTLDSAISALHHFASRAVAPAAGIPAAPAGVTP